MKNNLSSLYTEAIPRLDFVTFLDPEVGQVNQLLFKLAWFVFMYDIEMMVKRSAIEMFFKSFMLLQLPAKCLLAQPIQDTLGLNSIGYIWTNLILLKRLQQSLDFEKSKTETYFVKSNPFY